MLGFSMPGCPLMLAGLLLALPRGAGAEAPRAGGDVAASPPVTPDAVGPDDAGRVAELQRLAATLDGAYSNRDGQFMRDGLSVSFVSNRDDQARLYLAELDPAGAPPRRLLASSEVKLAHGLMSRDGKTILALVDKGGDWSVQWLPLDGRPPREVTVLERSNVTGLLPLVGEPYLYLSGQTKGSRSPAVYRASPTGTLQEIFWDPLPVRLQAMTADGSSLLLARRRPPADDELLLLDTRSRVARKVFPPPGSTPSRRWASISPDGTTLFVTSNLGGEHEVLHSVDASTGRENARYVEPGSWATMRFAIGTSSRLLILVDRGGQSVLRVLDAKTLEPVIVSRLPPGHGSGPSDLTTGGTLALVAWETPDHPEDLWLVDAQTGAARRALDESQPALASLPPVEASVEEVVAHDGLRLPVKMVRPLGVPGKLPVIVSPRGFAEGVRLEWNPKAAFFLSLGYAWVEPALRGAPGFGTSFEEADHGLGRRDAIRDIEDVGRWISSRPWADPTRLVLMGEGTDGYYVLAGLASAPDLWRAGVEADGLMDLRAWMTEVKKHPDCAYLLTKIGDPDKQGELLDDLSPIRHADRIVAPVFLVACARCGFSSLAQNEDLVARLRTRPAAVEYVVEPGDPESLKARDTRTRFLARVALFLERHAGPR